MTFVFVFINRVTKITVVDLRALYSFIIYLDDITIMSSSVNHDRLATFIPIHLVDDEYVKHLTCWWHKRKGMGHRLYD